MTLSMAPPSACQFRDDPPRTPRRRLLQLSALAALAGVLWLAAATLYHETRPVLGPATLQVPGESPRSLSYPLAWQNAPRTPFTLRQQLWLPARYPTTFAFYPQDFLWSLSVNGHPVQTPGLPLAAASCEGGSIDLAPYVHPGLNEIDLQMEVRWGEARLRLRVSPWDKYEILLLTLVISATTSTVILFFFYSRGRLARAEAAILLVGIALRALYLAGTPYFVRSYDYWGHVDYIQYIVHHLTLPPPNANWEAFQPPLYYLFTGLTTRLLFACGMGQDQQETLWQGLAFGMSIGVLLAGYAIARQIYTGANPARLYMLAAFAVAPPLVFNAARVSNDTLIVLLSFIWLALLLRYWQRPERAIGFALSVALGLALLTKANALVLVPISALCLALHPRLEAGPKWRALAVLLTLCGGISGWYYIASALHTRALDTYVVGNLHSLTEHARIQGVLGKSFVFNPFKLVRYPFAETWGPRHDLFLEVFFKTMLLGEWIKGAFYKPLARFMVAIALTLIPVGLTGIYKAATQSSLFDRPLLLTLAGIFLAQWLFLQLAPFISTQDFRYSAILLVPMTYFLLRGTEELPPRIKEFTTFLLQIALLNSAIYLVALSLGH